MIDRKSLRNPFHNDVVTSPEQSVLTDVREIHRSAFELCQKSYEGVAEDHSSLSVLLYGEAGCGKTHLLSRFRRWLNSGLDSRPSVAPAAFVAIRMETAPSQIWRHVRRRFAEEITKKAPDGQCPLDGILRRFMTARGGTIREAIDAAQIPGLGLDLANVLEHFETGSQRRLCRAWLAGDGMSDEDLRLLNVSSSRLEESEEDFAESNAERIVLAIVRMSRPSPVVFCFDQVEALGIAKQDNESFEPFGRMGAALVDESNNILFVSTVLHTFLRNLEDGCHDTDYVRISKRKLDLQPLDLKLGRALIDSRLNLVPELKGEQPIPEDALHVVFEKQYGRCNARRLIHEARRLFAEWQECEPPVRIPVPEFLHAEFEKRWTGAEVRSRPGKSDAVLAQGLPVTLQLLGKRTASGGAGLRIGEGESRIDVVFANQPSMQGLASSLRHLLSRRKPDASLCIVRDQQLPISPTAIATQDRLKKIQESGGRVVRVEAEALAALDAMQQLLTEATSGDLSVNGETVEAATVREWLRENLPQPVQKFADALLGPMDSPFESDALIELLGERKVVSVEEAAQAISWPRERVEEYARTNPLAVRWFGGSCPVVCLALAPDAAKEISHAE